jgi:5S rRNA maturation endonuclease (ribonuclease M5)
MRPQAPLHNFDHVREISNLATRKLDVVMAALGLQYRNADNSFMLPCPVHCGDNVTGCRVYNNSQFGFWQCFTRGCEKIFRDDTFGFVRGVLSQTRHRWDIDNTKKATVRETVDFLNLVLGPTTESAAVDRSKRDFVTQTNNLAVEPSSDGKWSRNLVRSRLTIPSRFFLSRGFSVDVLERFDVGEPSKGVFFGRAVVPVYDHSGSMAVGFSARAIGTETPKWMHSKFSRSRVLYNQAAAFLEARRAETLILVEGPCDVWRLWEGGYHNAVALLGVSLTDAQQVLMESSGASRVIVFMDDDEAGQVAAQKIMKQLSRSFRVVIAHAGQGRDPADLSVDEIKKILGRIA